MDRDALNSTHSYLVVSDSGVSCTLDVKRDSTSLCDANAIVTSRGRVYQSLAGPIRNVRKVPPGSAD